MEKAAIVVPAGFLTASKRSSKIAFAIRKQIVDNNWLRGVISMPSNIFATTGTNVSIIFLDKSRTEEDQDIILIDASKVGEKISLEDGQRTILSKEDEQSIVNTFKKKEQKDNFSVIVERNEILNKNYSFSAGQYFEVKLEYVELTQEEFNEKMATYSTNLKEYFAKGKSLEEEINQRLEGLKYE